MYKTDMGFGRTIGADMDIALRKAMLKVYSYMSFGLVITALVSYVAAVSGVTYYLLTNKILFFVSAFAPLLVVIFLSVRLESMTSTMAAGAFFFYAALMGISLSVILFAYSGADIVRAFLITASGFGVLSIYGYSTKKDLTAMGRFLIMAVWGLIIASVVNLFWKSSGFNLIISYATVLIFAGLTAYDTQRIKMTMLMGASSAAEVQKRAIMGALTLYLDFLNMFLAILRIFSSSRE